MVFRIRDTSALRRQMWREHATKSRLTCVAQRSRLQRNASWLSAMECIFQKDSHLYDRMSAARLQPEDRVRIYRSRSASKMIFEAISRAPIGARPAWFDFEKDCARLLVRRRLKVIHQSARRGGDAGVDLYAVDEEDKSWIVQCKCWAIHRPIGPEIVRELAGAIALADKGATRRSSGILITTSTFTSGAITVGAEFGFELIDGARFTELLGEQ